MEKSSNNNEEDLNAQVGRLTEDEIRSVRSIFNLYDTEGTNSVPLVEVESILKKIGYAQEDIDFIGSEAAKLYSALPTISEDEGAAAANVAEPSAPTTGEEEKERRRRNNRVYFDEFVNLLAKRERPLPGEKTDPKVLEFLRVLEQYRGKCEDEGNYLEAQRAHHQLELLSTQEEKRQRKVIRARQLSERQEVQLAHSMQFTDFNSAWDRYMDEFDKMAQMYIQQMTERHAHALLNFQRQLQQEITGTPPWWSIELMEWRRRQHEITEKPPRWSRELMEWRRRQHVMARQRNYTEAEKIRKIADRMEVKEKKTVEHGQAAVFTRRETTLRGQHQAELQALLKRIEARRREHVKQRNLDCKRLLQRNRNVQVVLESKQTVETVKLFADIKKNLDTAIIEGRYNNNHNKTKQDAELIARRKSLGLSSERKRSSTASVTAGLPPTSTTTPS